MDAPCSCEGLFVKTLVTMSPMKSNLKKRARKLHCYVRRLSESQVIHSLFYTYLFTNRNEGVVSKEQDFPDELNVLPTAVQHFNASPGLVAWRSNISSRFAACNACMATAK